ncbi:MAG: hypothetical protein QOG15_3548 [Solirubrobacteraceae bacterium]|jgi:hypothetical protein|nr:hypothetical protein [Solirubrobacteraceae bacterium]
MTEPNAWTKRICKSIDTLTLVKLISGADGS